MLENEVQLFILHPFHVAALPCLNIINRCHHENALEEQYNKLFVHLYMQEREK